MYNITIINILKKGSRQYSTTQKNEVRNDLVQICQNKTKSEYEGKRVSMSLVQA